ncbi:hypothetical protein GGP51_003009 [Salinibacter ruber]|uniref:sulfotransferase n=1 Tax=Salinibacter ruber TaxID=146919 RepID=UPI002166EFD3|nr:sulfotransferase [Salinibacter ruber]MCS4191513.1 hypothetical protein [Salinibacter ruber]
MIKRRFLHNQFLFSIGERLNLLNESVENTVIVSGVPRSGTTWLSEMIAEEPGYKLLSEPLFLRGAGERGEIGLEWRTHIEPNENDEDVEGWLRRALSGRIPGDYVLTSRSLPGRAIEFFLNQKNVVKFVRASRMLGWIDNTFDVRGIILLLRHPCAVVASQIHYDEDWKNSSPPDTDNLRRGYGGYLPDSFLNSCRDALSEIETREEYLAAMWSIDNIFGIRESDRANVLTTHYEDIVVDESSELKRIFDFLGFEDSTVRKIDPGKPSKTKSKTLTNDKQDQLSKWREFFTDEQVDRILSTVRSFGLNIYSRDVLPNR